MTNKLFGRKYALSVGPNGQTGKQWKDLRIVFDVTQSDAESANQSTIQVYNLSKDSRSYIKKGQIATLEAGYKDSDFGLICAGYIDRVSSKKQGADYVTTIEIKDGLNFLQASSLSLSFTSGTTLNQIIDKIISSAGFSRGVIKGIPNKVFNAGYSAFGRPAKILKDLTTSNGLKFFVTNQQINIIPKNEQFDSRVILLDYESGLLTVEPDSEGYQITSLLRASIKPGQIVKVESEAIKSNVKVVSLTHNGDLFGNWITRFLGKTL